MINHIIIILGRKKDREQDTKKDGQLELKRIKIVGKKLEKVTDQNDGKRIEKKTEEKER